jgi:hypothetical protein
MKATFLAFLLAGATALHGQRTAPPAVSASDLKPHEPTIEELNEDPDLFGATRVTGRGPTLPRPLFEYSLHIGEIVQRVAVFENGIAAVNQRGTGREVRKRIQLPVEKIADLRQIADGTDLTLADGLVTRGDDYMALRIWNDGKKTERLIAPLTALPQEIDLFKRAMTDLMNSIVQDRVISNPLIGYEPKVHDRLVADDGKLYEVTGFINDGTIVELRSAGKPLRMYVPVKELHTLFSGIRPAVQND